MFCKHEWKEVARTYAQTMAEQGVTKFSQCSVEGVQILQHGMTTILYECSECKKHKHYKMLGKEPSNAK